MNTTPSTTPNVVIENPAIRKGLRLGLDIIGGVTAIVAAVDLAAPEFDVANITGPIFAGYTVARAVFGFAVDAPNTPTNAARDSGTSTR